MLLLEIFKMARILRIDSSSRFEGSHSRAIADVFQNTWLAAHPGDEVVTRDVVQSPCPPIAAQTITGFYTPKEQHDPALAQATELSDRLIAELQAADVLVLSVPMYNFSVPSALKAWIDQIVRINETFAYDGQQFAGLVKVKRAYVICAYGAAGYIDGPFAGFNFLQPYLQGLLTFLGIPEVQFFAMEATTADEATVARNLAQVKAEIQAAIAAS